MCNFALYNTSRDCRGLLNVISLQKTCSDPPLPADFEYIHTSRQHNSLQTSNISPHSRHQCIGAFDPPTAHPYRTLESSDARATPKPYESCSNSLVHRSPLSPIVGHA